MAKEEEQAFRSHPLPVRPWKKKPQEEELEEEKQLNLGSEWYNGADSNKPIASDPMAGFTFGEMREYKD